MLNAMYSLFSRSRSDALIRKKALTARQKNTGQEMINFASNVPSAKVTRLDNDSDNNRTAIIDGSSSDENTPSLSPR